jgi:hypothetical protein
MVNYLRGFMVIREREDGLLNVSAGGGNKEK